MVISKFFYKYESIKNIIFFLLQRIVVELLIFRNKFWNKIFSHLIFKEEKHLPAKQFIWTVNKSIKMLRYFKIQKY